jgi:hypothetical protein
MFLFGENNVSELEINEGIFISRFISIREELVSRYGRWMATGDVCEELDVARRIVAGIPSIILPYVKGRPNRYLTADVARYIAIRMYTKTSHAESVDYQNIAKLFLDGNKNKTAEVNGVEA